jgi:hypothetical protein
MSSLSVGTQLKWFLDANTYRLAIIQEKGILQVASVTDGGGDCHPNTCTCGACFPFNATPPAPWLAGKRRPLNTYNFADEAAWRASLPKGGQILITPYLTSVEKKTMVPLNGSCDGEKLEALFKRFKIKRLVYTRTCDLTCLKEAKARLIQYEARNALGERPLINLSWAKQEVVRLEAKVASQTEQQNTHEPAQVSAVGKQAAFLIVGDEIKDIAYELYRGQPCILDSLGNRYKSFAEMGDCLNAKGKPRINVQYRGKMIPVSSLF